MLITWRDIFSALESRAPIQQRAYQGIKTFRGDQRNKNRQSNNNGDGCDTYQRPSLLPVRIVFDELSPILSTGGGESVTIRSVHALIPLQSPLLPDDCMNFCELPFSLMKERSILWRPIAT